MDIWLNKSLITPYAEALYMVLNTKKEIDMEPDDDFTVLGTTLCVHCQRTQRWQPVDHCGICPHLIRGDFSPPHSPQIICAGSVSVIDGEIVNDTIDSKPKEIIAGP
jgi:hypothetical protein